MASLDEDLQDRSDQELQDAQPEPTVDEDELEEEQRRQEALENYNQQQRQRQQQNQAQNLVNQVQTAKKWYKRYQKTVVVIEILSATSPIWIPLLITLFIVVAFVGGCNGSTTFRISSLGACEPFIFGETQAPAPASGGGGGGANFDGKLTDAQARAQFAAAGVGWNAPQPQTSFEGIFQATVTEAIALKQGCDTAAGSCTVTVTGGTEAGHAAGACSHGTGYKFDVRLNSALTSYVKTNFTPSGTRSDGAALYTNPASSALYALEGDHWDVAVGCSSNNE